MEFHVKSMGKVPWKSPRSMEIHRSTIPWKAWGTYYSFPCKHGQNLYMEKQGEGMDSRGSETMEFHRS